MSLRKGRHVVTVQPMHEDTYGSRGAVVQRLGAPVPYQVNVQPLSSSEIEEIGLKVATAYRVKYWPQEHGGVPWAGGPYSRITWDGREFDQQGEAMLSSMSDVTGHVRVVMTARGTEVK
ncbi:hypothetical protein [uncultured Rothia sp.]|uniref:hypothetical protein n=1 Tax=uncultured Rothia sp. TaxID=316088 RepID=UPI003217EF3E